jgi:hypothetical protein
MAIIAEKGFESVEYLSQLFDDVCRQEQTFSESNVNVLKGVFEHETTGEKSYKQSKEEYIGDEQDFATNNAGQKNKDLNFIRYTWEMFFYYPLKADTPESTDEQLAALVQKVINRFEQDDVTKVEYQSIQQFVQMFDLACCDIAKHDNKWTEANWRKIINDHDEFFDLDAQKKVYGRIYDKIVACLEYGEQKAMDMEIEAEEAMKHQKTHAQPLSMDLLKGDQAEAQPKTLLNSGALETQGTVAATVTSAVEEEVKEAPKTTEEQAKGEVLQD